MKRIFLTEDHAAFRKTLASMRELDPGYKVTAQAGSVADARAVNDAKFDVAVVDPCRPTGTARRPSAGCARPTRRPG